MRRTLQHYTGHIVFILLVAIAIVGRMDRLDWNLTPVAAVALFAGFYFRNRLVAMAVPLTALAISDLMEPAHTNGWMRLIVWGAMLLPVMLGPWLRETFCGSTGTWKKVTCGTISALLPATFFHLTTNFAVWATATAGLTGVTYSPNLSGLAACYTAAIPFYGKMLSGDLFYMTMLFGAYAIATLSVRESNAQPVGQ